MWTVLKVSAALSSSSDVDTLHDHFLYHDLGLEKSPVMLLELEGLPFKYGSKHLAHKIAISEFKLACVGWQNEWYDKCQNCTSVPNWIPPADTDIYHYPEDCLPKIILVRF